MTVQAVNGIALAQKQWKNKLDDKQSLEILIVNLMPTKETTELQFLKLLERTQINCRVTFAGKINLVCRDCGIRIGPPLPKPNKKELFVSIFSA